MSTSSWYKVTLDESDGNITERTSKLQDAFARKLASASLRGLPYEEMALLQAGDDLNGSVDIYFTPACHPHMEAIINGWAGEECERPPSAEDLIHLIGGHDWK